MRRQASEKRSEPKSMNGEAAGVSEPASGSNILTWCRPLASCVPPSGSPKGFDQTKCGVCELLPSAGLPCASTELSGDVGKEAFIAIMSASMSWHSSSAKTPVKT